MEIFYISVMPILSAIKLNGQGYFSKGKLNSVADAIKFTAFMFLFASLSLMILTVRALPSSITIMYALLLGALTAGYQIFAAISFRSGPVSLSSTIFNFANIIPITYVAIAFSEPISFLQIIGFIFVVASFILLPSKSDSGVKTSKKWLILCIIAVLFSGFFTVVQKMFTVTPFAQEKSQLTAFFYLFASTLCFLLIPFFKKGQKLYKTDVKLASGLALIGLSLGLYNLCVVSGLEIMPASQFLPTVAGLCILANVISSCIIFKEKLSIKQIIGIFTTICAVVLINL